jgi:hypothetical protein
MRLRLNFGLSRVQLPPGDAAQLVCWWKVLCGLQVMTIVVLALFWFIYCRYLLPMSDRLEQARCSNALFQDKFTC